MSAACLPNNATSISGLWGGGLGEGGRVREEGGDGEGEVGAEEGGLPIAAVTDLRDG